MRKIKVWWKFNKVIFISIIIGIILMVRLLVLSMIMYFSLISTNGIINTIQYDPHQRTLRLSLKNDDKTYFRKYDKKSIDAGIDSLQINKSILFYTTTSPEYKSPPLWNTNGQKGEYYYPIFNINSTKNAVSVFLYIFNKGGWLTIIMMIATINALLFSIPYIITANWTKRTIVILILAFLFWLWNR